MNKTRFFGTGTFFRMVLARLCQNTIRDRRKLGFASGGTLLGLNLHIQREIREPDLEFC